MHLKKLVSLKAKKDESYRDYYTLHFLYVLAVSLTRTTFVPYLKSKGLSTSDIHTSMACFSASVILLEVPLLAVTQKLGPLRSFFLGCAVKCCVALVFLSGSIPLHFYFAEILSGLAVALVSGSLDSWIISRIEQKSDQHPLLVYARAERLDKLGLAFGGTLGAYLTHWYSLSAAWVGVGASFFFLLFFGLWFIKGHLRVQKTPSTSLQNQAALNFGSSIKLAIAYFSKSPPLLILMSHAFLSAFILGSPKLFWIPYLSSHFGKGYFFVGNAWLVLASIQFLATFKSEALVRFFGSGIKFKVTLMATTCALLGVLPFYKASIYLFIVAFYAIEALHPYHQIATQNLVQTYCPKEKRMSFQSLQSLLSKLGTTAGLSAAAWGTQTYELNRVWGILLVPYFGLTCLSIWVIKRDLFKIRVIKS